MDTKELYAALALLEKERGISVDYMLSQIQRAIVVACKNTYGGNEDVTVIMDKEKEDFQVFLNKEVVEEVFDPNSEISLEAAREMKADYEIGDKVGFKLDPKEFGRIAINTSRSIIRQGIRDGEKGQMLQEFQSKHQELVTATVERVDGKNGAVTIKIGKAEAVLPRSEQVGNENFKEGDHIKVYIADVQDRECLFQELTPILSRDCLKQRFPKFMTEQLKSNRFQERQAQEQSLPYGARIRMLTLSEPA